MNHVPRPGSSAGSLTRAASRRQRGFVRVLALAALLPGAAGATTLPEASRGASDPEAVALIERLEAYHRGLPHFEARFEQRFSPRIFGRDRVEAGRLTVKRPARMRWDYESPEVKVFVSDGANTWFHVPADRQVVVGAFGGGEAEGEGLNPLDFLTGDAAILDHFDALMEPEVGSIVGTPVIGSAGSDASEPPASALRAISLVPRDPNGDLTPLSLTVEAATGQLRGLESEDPEGNRTTFHFRDFRVGASPDDGLFTLAIPPGTEVVTATDLRP